MTILSGLLAVELLALRSLPYSTSWIERPSEESIALAPDSTFQIGSLVWQVSAYASDPSLQAFRDEFQQQCAGTGGKEAAMCVILSIHARSPSGKPQSEFVDPDYEPTQALKTHLAGGAGHCVTRSALAAAELLSVGIPAYVVQIFSASGEGHTLFSVLDKSGSWILFDPNAPGVIAVNGTPASIVDLLRDPSRSTLISANGSKSGSSVLESSVLASTQNAIIPEPWLYLRAGHRVAPWPFRGRFVLIGKGGLTSGTAQKVLVGGIILKAVALSCLALKFGLACLLALQRPSSIHSENTRALSGNLDPHTVRDFGREWKHFDQTALSAPELRENFERYFRLFPWELLPPAAQGFDLGCGSGRWAKFVAPKVGALHCVDASEEALSVAKAALAGFSAVKFHHASVDELPFEDASMDFGYSIGVLHHIPDTLAGLTACVSKLRPGAPFLVYLYYSLDNRPLWFRVLWRVSDLVRRLIAPVPHLGKVALTFPIALFVYLPLSRLARFARLLGLNADRMPLSYYRNSSFYTLRTDALDRFGTRLERRFSAVQVRRLMNQSGLVEVKLSDSEPFWCAVGIRS